MKTVKDAQIKKVDDVKEVKELLAKQREISDQVAAVDVEIQTAQRQSSDVSRQATEFLAGGEVGSAQKEIDILHHRKRVLREAMQQVESLLFNQRAKSAKELAVVYRPEFEVLSQRTLKAMIELKDSLIKERSFFDAMRLAGLVDHYKERQDTIKLLGGQGFEDHVDHSLLHRHIMHRQG